MLTIKTFDDLYPHIKDYPWLQITNKEEDGMVSVMYSVLNHADQETDIPLFPNEWAKECRGIKFHADTKDILARPFNKFFNLGEVEGDLDNHDLSKAQVLEKLDGSMVYPIIHPLTNKVRLCTKAGISEISIQAEQETNPPLRVMRQIIEEGYTPIFEYTSPKNRIVIRYNTSSLTLLAVRHMITGEYVQDLSSFCKRLGIPIVKQYEDQLALEEVRKWKGSEGIVLVWSNGYRLKLKAEEYVLFHHTKEAIRFEKDRALIVLEDKLDDFKSLISKEDYQALLDYRKVLIGNISSYADKVFQLFLNLQKQGLTKKDIALTLSDQLTTTEKWCVFLLYSHSMSLKDFVERLHKEVIKRCTGAGQLNKVREIIGEDSFVEDPLISLLNI